MKEGLLAEFQAAADGIAAADRRPQPQYVEVTPEEYDEMLRHDPPCPCRHWPVPRRQANFLFGCRCDLGEVTS